MRAVRLCSVGVIWLAGLVAGFFGLLGAAARYGCSSGDHGLACRTPGSLLGVLLIVAVIAVVTAVTVLSHGRPARDTVLLAVSGVAALAVCFVAARMLLDTI